MTNSEYLKELIANLSTNIPYQWRVQSFSKQKPQATCVAYIDARDAIDMLNKYATFGWHREYYTIGENVYCRVGLVMPDNTIQWRSDCGVESQSDGVKGESSDSFKRACVNWGIGRFLYDLGMQYINANEVKSGSNYPYCVDDQGKRIWDLTKHINDKANNNLKKPAPKNPEPKAPPAIAPSKEFDVDSLDDRKRGALAKFKEMNKDWKIVSASIMAQGLVDEKFKSHKRQFNSLEEFVKESTIEFILSVYNSIVK